DSSSRSAHSTTHRKSAGRVSYHSRRRISCAASQREAKHGVSWLEAVRWWSAKVVSAIGVVPIALDLLWRDENVLPVLSAPRVDVATEVPDFGRVAIRIITTASVGIIRHVSCRIKLLVQSLILGRMAMLRSGLQGRDPPPGMLVAGSSYGRIA